MNIFNKSCEEEEKKPKSSDPKDYVNLTAEIPEWQPHADPWEEYQDYPEEKIWSPLPGIGECWVPLFMFMARSALTCAQERQGISNKEAMENSCNGYAEQYISDILHDSAYIPGEALRRLVTKQLPDKLFERWTRSDIATFGKGLNLYGKKFTTIRSKLLPHKTTGELVEFYYTWKRSKEAKGLVASRARRFLRLYDKETNLIIGPPTATGMLTRGQLAEDETSGTPVTRIRSSRSQVYTAVKRKRRITRQTRHRSIKA